MDAMQYNKRQLLMLLQEEFKRWEEFLGSLSKDQITARRLSDNLSVKDVVAHLWAWQQLSIARMEAALQDWEPTFSLWSEPWDAESAAGTDRINAEIYAAYRDKPWPQVYADWRAGFLRFLELCEQISGQDLLDPEKYGWLEGRPLALVLLGSYKHHHDDHLEPLLQQFG